MKKIIISAIIIITFIVALVFGTDAYKYIDKKIEISKMPSYYSELAIKCLKDDDDDGCCFYSVQAMEYGNYKLSEDGKCGDGFTPNMILCISSYQWCEPTKP